MTVADQIDDLFEGGSMRAQIAHVIFQGGSFTMPGLGEKFSTHATNVRSVITRMKAAGYQFNMDSDGGHKSPVVYTLLDTKPSTGPYASQYADPVPVEAEADQPRPRLNQRTVNERSMIENLIDLLELQYMHGIPVSRIEPAAEWIRLTRELFAE